MKSYVYRIKKTNSIIRTGGKGEHKYQHFDHETLNFHLACTRTLFLFSMSLNQSQSKVT